MEVVGTEVASHIASFHRATRLEIALNVYRHNRYCSRRGWSGLDSDSPFTKVASSISPIRLAVADYLDRLERRLLRLSRETPNSRGLSLRPPNLSDCMLAKELGFCVKSSPQQRN